MPERADAISKCRLDALTDGVFGVAMTLLVIDIRLPENFRPASAAELLDGVADLKSKFLVYMISFFVVGLRWLGNTKLAAGRETVSIRYAKWTLVHLFLITCMPFSTMLIGRHDTFALPVWVYAANIILGALVTLRLTVVAAHDDGRPHEFRAGDRALVLLIASAALSVIVSFISPG